MSKDGGVPNKGYTGIAETPNPIMISTQKDPENRAQA
jgi:hypothetical protein